MLKIFLLCLINVFLVLNADCYQIEVCKSNEEIASSDGTKNRDLSKIEHPEDCIEVGDTSLSDIDELSLAELREKLGPNFVQEADCKDWRFARIKKNGDKTITTKDLIQVDSEPDIMLRAVMKENSNKIHLHNFYEIDLTDIRVYTGEAVYEATINPNMKLDSFRRLLNKSVICKEPNSMILPNEKVLQESENQSFRVVDGKSRSDLGLDLASESNVAVLQKLYRTKVNDVYIDYTNLIPSWNRGFVGSRTKHFKSNHTTVSVDKQYPHDDHLKPLMLSSLRSTSERPILWRNALIAENGTSMVLQVCDDLSRTRRISIKAFGVPIYSGYCAEECCPVEHYSGSNKNVLIRSRNVVKYDKEMRNKKMTITITVEPIILRRLQPERKKRQGINFDLGEILAAVLTKGPEKIRRKKVHISDKDIIGFGAREELTITMFNLKSKEIADKFLIV